MSHEMSEVKDSTPQRAWGWVLGLGILFIILGCIGLSMVVGLTTFSIDYVLIKTKPCF